MKRFCAYALSHAFLCEHRIVHLIFALACAMSVLPMLAHAGAQLTQFGVDNPPPPESEPTPTPPSSGHSTSLAAPGSQLPTNDPTVGTMAGEAGASGGAAIYTVPIVVPPGRAGMQPALSLTYNSRAGNGPMGVGWTISGLSSIHRCPQTAEQDGQTLGVSYSNNDRLCLDGQRLIPVSGTYGLQNTEYRTEVDSYTRIIQVGGDLQTATGGPGTATCFRVEQRDGRILHYGAVVTGTSSLSCSASTANSRVNPSRTPTAILSWLVEKIEDRVGNNQLYQYSNSFGAGETLISTITYTGFTSTAGNRTVTFNYGSRSGITGVADITSSYLAGGLTVQTQALQSITTAVGGATVRTYTPSYIASAYSGRLLLQSLTECGGTTCHTATTFLYNDGALNTASNFPLTNLSSVLPAQSGTVTAPDMPYQLNTIADLDGDGARETALTFVAADGTQHLYLLELTADRKASTPVDLTSTPFTNVASFYADIDGSGRAALIELPTSTSVPQVLSFGIWNYSLFPRGTPATSNPLTVVASSIPYSVNGPNGGSSSGSGAIFAADVDGDGKIDVITTGPSTTCGSDALGTKNGVFVWINTTTGALAPGSSPTFQPSKGTSGSPLPQFCLTRTQVGSSPPEYQDEHVEHIADFDGNGLPDFYLTTTDTYLGRVSFGRIVETQRDPVTHALTNTPVTPLHCDGTASDDECSWYNGYATHWIDINGDGLEDFVIGRAGGSWQVRLNLGNGTLGTAITPTLATGTTYVGLDSYQGVGSPPSLRYANSLPTMDVDGDGKPDILIPSQTQGVNGFAVKMCTMTKVSQLASSECPGGGTFQQCPAYACPEDPGTSAVNMPANPDMSPYKYEWNGQVAYGAYGGGTGRTQGIDNSTYHLAMLKFVQTGPTTITLTSIETPLVAGLNQSLGQHTDDLFGDGLPDLVTPVGCANYKVGITLGSPTWSYPMCSAVNDGTHGPATMPDGVTTTASFQSAPTLFVNANEGVSSQSMPPGAHMANRVLTASQPISSPQAVSLGLAIPGFPGLISKAVNGVSDTTFFDYLPLSYPIVTGAFQFYTVQPTNGYTDNRHYYFESSMPVIQAIAQLTGNGKNNLGFRSSIFGYAGAIYNHFGRGFEGFQQILTETASADSDAARRVLTTTTYNQEYPLVGKVTDITKTDLATGHVFQHETDTYQCSKTSDGSSFTAFSTCPQGNSLSPLPTGTAAFQSVLATQSLASSDAGTGTQSSHATTTNTWDNDGNVTNQTIISGDDPLSTASLASHTEQTTNSFDYTNVGSWWLNQLTGTTVTTSMAYGTAHPYPPGGNPPSQTLTINYTWNADRTLSTKTVQPTTTNQQSVTTLCYPQSAASTSPSCPQSGSTSYGLPTLTKVCLGAYDIHGVCQGDVGSALSPERTTSYTYTNNGTSSSADGYFVYTTTDSLSYPTTTTRQTSDGQVLKSTDPNGVQTITKYDSFGRVTEIDHLGNDNSTIESSIQIAYNSCLDNSVFPPNTGKCSSTLIGEDIAEPVAYEGNTSYRVTTSQAGYPTTASWIDILGRPIRQGHVGFDGTFIATLTSYDDLGTMNSQSTPYFAGTTSDTTPFLTTWTYDALNRPIKKVVDDSELTVGQTKLQTDYLYSGRTTTWTVHDSAKILGANNTCPAGSGNLCLVKDSKTNALGQIMQTDEKPILGSGSTTTTLTTSFWTEPFGHMAAMTDAEGNLTTASYNPLGQRTQSDDPDQGKWLFTYDALSEPLTTTDNRGVVTTVNKRDALGRLKEQQQVPPAPAPSGLANETELDDWSYDPANGIHEVGSIARRRGTGNSVPLQMATPVWQEGYTYEAATARLSTTTTTINEGASMPFSSGVAYDSSGRVLTHTYPSGLVVKNNYTSYGQLSSLSNSTSGAVYWTATAENEWGHVTGETFTGGVTGTHADYHSTGQASSLNWPSQDKFVYGYDSFQNVVSQTRTIHGANIENYTYDPLQRLTTAARTSGTAATVNFGYTASGNLAFKDDFSVNANNAYTYASTNGTTNNCGPHAANTITLPGSKVATYTCDANGNVIGGNTISSTYDADNHPRLLTRTFLDGGAPYEPCAVGHNDDVFCDGFEVLPKTSGTGSTTWVYDSNGQRDYESSSQQGTHYYAPAGYEYLGTGVSKHELGPVIVTRTGASDAVTVVLRDRLGSTLDTLDGSYLAQRAYDAFGATRNGDMSNRPHGTLNLLPDTIHGFTSHTHEDDVGLVHMNGRIYDYTLGRFLSVDPRIADPLSSQALNPYSYLSNNPLAGRDPTGYAGCTTGTNFSDGNGQSCEDLGVSVSQIGSPSVSEKNDAISHYFGVAYGSPSTYANVPGNGAVGMSEDGAGGAKNAQAPASDQMGLENTSNTTPGQQPPAAPQTSQTLQTVNVSARAGAWATPEQLAALQALDYESLQGPESARETKFYMNDAGKVLRKTQVGCNGADRCVFPGDETPQDTSLYGHTHVYSNGAKTGALASNEQQAAQISRDMPGPGDGGPLMVQMVSAIVTRGGEKYVIEGTSAKPQIRYVGGGNEKLGTFTQDHWKPGANILHVANDYVNSLKEKQ